VFREEHGRAVAVLVRAFGDIELAEDAVQDAFAAACERWATTGLAPEPRGLDHHHRPQPRDRSLTARVFARRPAR
jgi:predicted RNA polymerase sigma factor